jgi:hypothetical protein
MKEIWKDIKGYEGLYQVSNYGRVKSLERIVDHKKTGKVFHKERILKQNTCYGYKTVILCKNSKTKSERVHRLVAQAFIPNPNNMPQINHKNQIRNDNYYKNLEWCDSKYNNNYGNRSEKIAEQTRKRVEQYDLNGNYIKTWNSLTSVEKELKIHIENIIKVCKGLRNKTGGYIWKYER